MVSIEVRCYNLLIVDIYSYYLDYFVFCIIPVRLELKNIIRTPKSDSFIYKEERKLLNKRIGNINNIIEHYEHKKYMYGDQLKSILGPDRFKLCKEHINIARA